MPSDPESDPTPDDDAPGDVDVRLRAARPDDYESVASFTGDTWADRGHDDYLPDAYHEWIAGDGGTKQTFVLDASATPGIEDGTVAAIVQAVMVSEWEAWFQGMRVNPTFRRQGLATRLLRACCRWARERGATVARNWVHSWNVASLGLTRTAGFDTGIELRWAHPDPDPDAAPDPGLEDGLRVEADPDAAWAFWVDADTRTALRGVTLDSDVSWAVSALTREHLHAVAEDDRLLVVSGGGTRGFSYRNRTVTRGDEDDEDRTTVAEYAVGAWADPAAAAALLAAVTRDAAAVGADETRVFVPEGIRWAGDVAGAGVRLAEEPSFVTAADLTDERVLGDEPAAGRE